MLCGSDVGYGLCCIGQMRPRCHILALNMGYAKCRKVRTKLGPCVVGIWMNLDSHNHPESTLSVRTKCVPKKAADVGHVAAKYSLLG